MGILRSVNHKVHLHRVPLFVDAPLAVAANRGTPAKLDIIVKCKDLPKVGRLLAKRKPLVRVFEQDPQTGACRSLVSCLVLSVYGFVAGLVCPVLQSRE